MKISGLLVLLLSAFFPAIYTIVPATTLDTTNINVHHQAIKTLVPNVASKLSISRRMVRRVHRTNIVIVTVVCSKPRGMLAMLFKVLLYSIAVNLGGHSVATVMVVYDPLMTPDPTTLLCDEQNHTSITDDFIKYLSSANVKVQFYPVATNEFSDRWGRCASSKLWIHDMLPKDVEAAIVVDVDTMFLENPHNMWDIFFDKGLFNVTTIYGAVAEGTEPPFGFYDETNHSWGELGEMKAGKHGINAGVLLVNLTRARNTNMSAQWSALYSHRPSYSTYKFFDNDLLNVQLRLHPEQLVELPCRWNQRSWAFGDGNTCKETNLSLNRGVAHGSRGLFLKKSFSGYKHKISNSTHYLRAAFYYYLLSMRDDPQWCMQRSVYHDQSVLVEVVDATSFQSSSVNDAILAFVASKETIGLIMVVSALVILLVAYRVWRHRTHHRR